MELLQLLRLGRADSPRCFDAALGPRQQRRAALETFRWRFLIADDDDRFAVLEITERTSAAGPERFGGRAIDAEINAAAVGDGEVEPIEIEAGAAEHKT